MRPAGRQGWSPKSASDRHTTSVSIAGMRLELAVCYRAVQSRDARFDGRFFTAVTSTGIYCRPVCPAQTPLERNVRFYPSAAAAEAAGFRACRRCRPDLLPGSAEWNTRADLAGRALRLIAEGVVDTEGVSGLARRLSVSERHLHRELAAEVGTGPLQLARTRRAQTARLLIDQTDLPLTEIAYASGFSSIRQFNESFLESFGCSPTELRRQQVVPVDGTGSFTLRLPYRPPHEASALLEFLSRRAIPGVEEYAEGVFRRVARLPRSAAVVELESVPGAAHFRLRLQLDDLRDLSTAVQRCRHLLDLDADPAAVVHALSQDLALAPLVAARPGLRIPGAVEGWEMAARAVLGQQISVAGARTLAGRLVEAYGEPMRAPSRSLKRLFPTAEAVAEADLGSLGLPRQRANALRALASAVASGALTLDRGADRDEVSARLLALPGIGPWTIAYIRMRALGDPDAFPSSDLALRQAAERLGIGSTARTLTERAEAWRPWRSYAAVHLWSSVSTSHARRKHDAVSA